MEHSDFFISLSQLKEKVMSKNKLIAIATIAVLIFLPFQWAYVDFSTETQLIQVLCMAVVVIGSVVAILIFNKKTGGESHH